MDLVRDHPAIIYKVKAKIEREATLGHGAHVRESLQEPSANLA